MKKTVNALGIAIILLLLVQIVVMFSAVGVLGGVLAVLAAAVL